jgi:hypothetical protein
MLPWKSNVWSACGGSATSLRMTIVPLVGGGVT